MIKRMSKSSSLKIIKAIENKINTNELQKMKIVCSSIVGFLKNKKHPNTRMLMSKFSSAAKSERKFLASKIVGRNREFSNAEGIFLNTLQRVGSNF